jgi:hypothetical protein
MTLSGMILVALGLTCPTMQKPSNSGRAGTTRDARSGIAAKATVLARSVESGGRPTVQHELCALHADQVAERERGKGGS